MTDQARGGRATATEHQSKLIGLLGHWQHRSELPPTAREGVRWALREWQQGIDLRSDLLTGRHDADARLATIRLGLLGRLAALWPLEPLGERPVSTAWASSRMDLLLVRGDATPPGWCVAVREALQAVAATPLAEPSPQDPERLRHPARGVAFASSLWRMTWPDTSVTVALGCSEPEAPGAPAAELHCTRVRLNGESDRRTMSRAAWRALHACCAGLYAIDRLGLSSHREEAARRALTDAAQTLSDVGVRWGEAAVARTVAGVLDACAAPVGGRQLATVIRETVPESAAMAAVMRGLDLLAGSGFGSPARARMFAPPLRPSRLDDDEQ